MIVLASQSQARHRLLAQAGVTFIAKTPKINEIELKTQFLGESSAELAQRLATAKSLSLTNEFKNDLILGADQTLAWSNRSLSKPKNLSAARSQLQDLRNQTHTLYSAITVSRKGHVVFRHCATATLSMRNFSDDYLDQYLAAAGDHVLHCVGSYEIEGLGLNLFSEINGDLFTIQGLPLLPLLAFLREVGELPS